MGAVRPLFAEFEPEDGYGPGFFVHALQCAVRDLDQFTNCQLAPEIAELQAANERLADRIAKILDRERAIAAS